jgi:DNA-binding transcriptional MerR regulator
MDFKIYNSKSKLEFRKFEQDMRNVSRRRIRMLDVSLAKIKQELSQQFKKDQLEMDQGQRMRLLKAKQAIEEKIARAQANAANRASMFSAGFTIAGAVAGSLIPIPGVGTAAGAAIGASVGGAVGSIVAGATAEKPNYNRGVDVRNY